MFSMLLLSGVSAVMIDDQIFNGSTSTSATINNGDSINFNIWIGTASVYLPMKVSVVLKDSADNLIYTFAEHEVNTVDFVGVYTINRSMYGNAGDFVIEVYGEDAFPSQDLVLASLKVNPDATKPVITLNGVNPQFVTLSTPYVEAGVSAIDNLDGDITSKVITDSTNVNTGLTGTYTVFYAVSDNAGNTITAQRTIKVVASGTDITNPTVTITAPVNGATYTNADSLSFTATDANLNSCEYSLNGGTKVAVSCASGVLTTITPLTSVEGTNTWTVYAKDVAGNEGNASVTFTINPTAVDTTAPVITVGVPESNKTYTNNRITFSVLTDENSTVQLEIDNGSRKVMTNPSDHIFTYTTTLLNGDHTITFYATDTAGNTATPISVDFTVNEKKTSSKSGSSSIGSEVQTLSTGSQTSSSDTGSVTPIVLDLTQPAKKQSIFDKIFEAIGNFFKWLFGIKSK